MQTSPSLALLFRGTAADSDSESTAAQREDAYLAALSRVGISAKNVPVLRFEYSNLDQVASIISANNIADQYDGIVLTSQRAATAIDEALSGVQAPRKNSCFPLPIFVVGAATQQAVQRTFSKYFDGTDCRGSDCGDARALGNLVLQHFASVAEGTSLRLLFLCGEQHMPTLEQVFSDHNVSQDARFSIALEEVIVYRSVPLENIELPLDSDTPVWLVFFSPSGWTNFLKQHKDLLASSKHILLAAIGQTTATAMRDSGHTVHAVAQKPTATDLAQALYEYSRIQAS